MATYLPKITLLTITKSTLKWILPSITRSLVVEALSLETNGFCLQALNW